MKNLSITLGIMLVVLMLPVVAHAQQPGDLIVLNDSTPAIDVVINPSPDTTGVVALEIDSAAVMITDAVGNVVFETNAPDIESLEFHFAPNAGMHTLTVERLPGASQAYSRIVSLSEMTASEVVPNLVESTTLGLAQEADYPLTGNAPSSTVDFNISETDQYGTLTASFPGAPVTLQLADVQENRTVATLYASLIDGVRFTVDSGAYEMVMLNNNSERQTVANVSLTPASASDFNTLVAQAQAANTTTMTDTTVNTTTATDPTTTTACTLTIAQSSVDLRSGPGTGYSVLDYAFRGDVLPVGGFNPQSGWVLVGTETGSGWTPSTLGMLTGSCDNLTAYDVPYRDAPTPEVIIQQPQVPVYHDDEHEGYEDDDRFEHESFENDD